MDKIKVILDVDTGTDDAVAILMSICSPDIEILGITTVNGNRNIDITTENTLRVVDYMGMGDKIPVARGCALPMVATLDPARKPLVPYGDKPFDGSENHGQYLEIPEHNIKEIDKNAVSFIIDTLMSAEDNSVTLVPLGPLTNIGMALRAEPRIVSKIKEMVIMGGGYEIGNSGPQQRAEFNFWCDPEAAEITMRSGVPITLVPLDATFKSYITKGEVDKLIASGKKAAEGAAIFIGRRIGSHNKWNSDMMGEHDSAAVHDALCVAYLLDRSVAKDIRLCQVVMDYHAGTADGVSLVNLRENTRDLDGKFRPAVKNANFMFSAHRDKFAEILVNTLTL